MQEIQIQFLCWEDPLEKDMANHSNILFFFFNKFFTPRHPPGPGRAALTRPLAEPGAGAGLESACELLWPLRAPGPCSEASA